jgi:hypothetical protein
MNSEARKQFEDDDKEEVFTSTPVMLQQTKRPLLPHEWLKLLGITNEIQRAKIESKKNKGNNSIQVQTMSKPIINKLIRTGYRIFQVSLDTNPEMKWYVIAW